MRPIHSADLRSKHLTLPNTNKLMFQRTPLLLQVLQRCIWWDLQYQRWWLTWTKPSFNSKADKCNLRPGFPSHLWLMKMPVKILGLGSCRANVSIHDSWWPWGWDHYHWTRPAWEGGATGSQPRVIEGLDIFWRTPWIRSFNTVIKRILWWWYLRLYGYKKPWLQ